MSIQWLVKDSEDRMAAVGQSRPVLLMSRIRLARNLSGLCFPGWAKAASRKDVFVRCRDAIAHVSQMVSSVHCELEGLTDLEKQLLVEKHLISKELVESAGQSGVTIAGDRLTSIMINEEDHLRIQVMCPKLDFGSLWANSSSLDDALEKHLDFAFHPEWGYLTACPTNLGTGLRASAMLHLPGLMLDKQMEKVVRAVNHIGIVARGLFGEASDPSGSIFQISNQQTLGETEEVILGRIQNVIQVIIDQEWKARQRLFESGASRMLDRIGRALGLLQHSYLLSSGEAMNLISMLRLGADVGLLPDGLREKVDRLIMEIQPAHLQVLNSQPLNPAQRDELRARVVRQAFGGMTLGTLAELSFGELDKTEFSSREALDDDPGGAAID